MTAEPIVIWTQWDDLPLSSAAARQVTVLSSSDGVPTAEQCARITFYVPRYMGRPGWLDQVPQMPRLRVLQLPNAGFDDAVEFARPGLKICNAAGVHDESTAELAVALTLAARRGFSTFGRAQVAGTWKHRHFRALTDSRVAIVGYGRIGKTINRMLGGFAVEVTAFTRTGRDDTLPVSQLAERIGSFDVVILIMPLNDDSVGMFNAQLLAKMADGALLVNVARGGIVDTDALVAELEAGRLYAALDVTDPEPLPDGHRLWRALNCVITPHVGGDTSAFFPRMKQLISDQVDRILAGDSPSNIVIDGVA